MEETFKPWWYEFEVQKQKETIGVLENGGAIEQVEVSSEKSCIPEGALHKELSHLENELPVTKKGINVLHLTDGTEPETLEELQAKEQNIVVDAEIEREEIIFSKELTDYVEVRRKQWNETKDNQLLLEIGMRVTKELLTNTDDNTGLIDKIEEKL